MDSKISESLLYDLIHSSKAEGIYLSEGGEPLTFPLTHQFIEVFTENSINVALISNGALISKNNIDILKKLSYIAISIYSTDKSEYSMITSGNKFEQQFQIPDFIRSNSPLYPLIGARCVINSHNYKSIKNVYYEAINSGYDYIIFIPAVDYENRGLGLNQDERDYLFDIFSNTDFDSSKTNLNNLLLNKFSYYKQNKFSNGNSSRCESIHLRSNCFINYDGGVYICQPHINNPDFCIGNIYENNFSKIWNSPRHLEVINKLNFQWSQNKCQNCRYISYNKHIEDYRVLKNNIPIKIVKDSFL